MMGSLAEEPWDDGKIEYSRKTWVIYVLTDRLAS
jgi:hypothetical protein